MSKHTPGPWEVKHNGSGNPYVVMLQTGMVVDGLGQSTPEAEANAALIAAAPDMLEALRLYVTRAEGCGASVDREVWKLAKAAIAKAQPTSAD